MDLRQIHEFIARDSVRYAAMTVVRIREAVARLGKFPQSGRAVPEFPESAYREVIVGNYRAIYRHDPNAAASLSSGGRSYQPHVAANSRREISAPIILRKLLV
jgi:plasmid stabilization system protein ParE